MKSQGRWPSVSLLMPNRDNARVLDVVLERLTPRGVVDALNAGLAVARVSWSFSWTRPSKRLGGCRGLAGGTWTSAPTGA
jgi:hypothetical protein